MLTTTHTSCLLKPCRRASDSPSIFGHKGFRETASLCKSSRDVFVECRVAPKFVAYARLRIEHKNGRFYAVANRHHDRRKVGIPRDENKAVRRVFVCIAKHFGGDVYIRQLFRYAKDLDSSVVASFVAGSARLSCWRKEFLLFSVAPFDYLNKRTVRYGVKVFVLPSGMPVVWSPVDDSRCKILDCDKVMVRTQKFPTENINVQPLVRSVTQLSIVEVPAVDVNNGVLHVFFPVVQEPSFRPALRRLPEGWRVNMTLLRVQRYYSKLAA